MKKYLAEFIGTFVMIFCGTGAIIVNTETGGAITHVGVATTWGLIVTAMIYLLGNISGAHFNPAVTIGLFFAKVFPIKEVVPYIFSQAGGAFLASMVLHFLFPLNHTLGASLPAGSAFQSFILEFILAFILMFVILAVVSKEQKQFAGLIIGFVILLEALFAGPICGASMNPIRSLSPALISGHTEHLWIYLTAPFLGAAGAVVLLKLLK